MIDSGATSQQLRQLIEKLERLEQEKAQVAEVIRETFQEAKSQGFDPKILRKVLKVRAADQEKLEEEEELIQAYLRTLLLEESSAARKEDVE